MTASLKPRSWIDPALKTIPAGNRSLTIQLSHSELLVSVLNKENNEFVALEVLPLNQVLNDYQWSIELSEKLKLSVLMKEPSDAKRFVIDHNKFTIVPETLFDEKSLSEYLKLSVGEELGASPAVDSLLNARSKFVYYLPGNVESVVKKELIDIEIRHSHSCLIDSLIPQFKNEEGDTIVLNIQQKQFEVIYFKGGSWNLFNSFEINSSEDLVYYTLFILEQLQLSNEKVKVVLYGAIKNGDDQHNLISKYISNVVFGERNSMCKYSPILDGINGTNYFTLFQQSLCV